MLGEIIFNTTYYEFEDNNIVKFDTIPPIKQNENKQENKIENKSENKIETNIKKNESK